MRTPNASRMGRVTALDIIVVTLASFAVLLVPGSLTAANYIYFTKTGPGSARVGDTITYTFRVENTNPSHPMMNVYVTDPLLGAGWVKELGAIEPFKSKEFSHTYTVKSTDHNPLVNTATAHGRISDLTYQATASHSVEITSPSEHPAIALVKTAPNDPRCYETVTYTMFVFNTGDVPLHGVLITDSMVPDFCGRVGTLAPGENAFKTMQYTITPESGNPLRNVGFVYGISPLGTVVTASSECKVKWTTAGKTQHLPNQTTRQGFNTYTAVQNTVGVEIDGKVKYLNGEAASYEQTNPLSPNARGTFNANDTPGMPQGDYSAVVQSDQAMEVAMSTLELAFFVDQRTGVAVSIPLSYSTGLAR